MRAIRVAALLTVLIVTGCASVHSSPPQHLAPLKTEEERFNDRWVGKSEDDVLVQSGQPDQVLPLSNGNHVNSYHREVSSSSGRGVITQYGGGQRSSSQTTTIYCDRRFEIDKATLKVARAVITGSSCDFSK